MKKGYAILKITGYHYHSLPLQRCAHAIIWLKPRWGQEGHSNDSSEKLCQRLLSFVQNNGDEVEEIALRAMAGDIQLFLFLAFAKISAVVWQPGAFSVSCRHCSQMSLSWIFLGVSVGSDRFEAILQWHHSGSKLERAS